MPAHGFLRLRSSECGHHEQLAFRCMRRVPHDGRKQRCLRLK
jgi:hypothetical protein